MNSIKCGIILLIVIGCITYLPGISTAIESTNFPIEIQSNLITHEETVSKAFSEYIIAFYETIKNRIEKDPLDPTPVDNEKWELTMKKIVSLHSVQKLTKDQWGQLAANAIIKSSLSKNNFLFLEDKISIHELLWEFILMHRNLILEKKFDFYLQHSLYASIHIVSIKVLVQDYNLSKSEAASKWIRVITALVKNLSEEERILVVGDPFLKPLIEEVKEIERTNKWKFERTLSKDSK